MSCGEWLTDMQKKSIQMSESTAVMAVLTLSGGLQDAYSYFVRGKVFANAQTGNLVLMSEHFFTGDLFGGLRYLIPVLAFAAGVLFAEQIRARCRLQGAVHWRQIIVCLELIMLVIVGLLPVTDRINILANAFTSMACAMQVQAFRKVNGNAYASTMCIGNMRSCMDAFSAFLRTGEKPLLKKAGQYFLILMIFVLGAGVGGVLAKYVGSHMIWISGGFLAVSFMLMLIPEREKAVC